MQGNMDCVMIACFQTPHTPQDWDHIPLHLLDAVKPLLQPRAMMSLRLVNRHWSAWATESTTWLCPPQAGHRLEWIVQKFVNLRTLHLQEVSHIAEGQWHCLRRLPSLTCLGVHEGVTDSVVKCLGHLDALQDLDLGCCWKITDLGLKHLSMLTSLTKLDLHYGRQITDEGLSCLARLTALRDLGLGECEDVTDVGLSRLSVMTVLTRLCVRNFHELTDGGLSCLESFTSLRDLALFFYTYKKITDATMRHLGKLTSLSRLSLGRCSKISDKGLSYIVGLRMLRDLRIFGCQGVTDDGIRHLVTVTSIVSLGLEDCPLITEKALVCLRALPALQHIDLRGCTGINNICVSQLASLTYLVNRGFYYCSNIANEGLSLLGSLTTIKDLHAGEWRGITEVGVKHLIASTSLDFDIFNCTHMKNKTSDCDSHQGH